MMRSEIITCKDPATGDLCYRILHPSGLEIRVMEMPDFSTAYAQFGTKFGSVYRRFRMPDSDAVTELPAGTAHFLEHKLFEKEDGDVAKKFAMLGASDNAFTDYDRTVYYFRTQQNFYEALALLLEFVQQPFFTEESTERERSIILQELMETLDDPADQGFMQLMEGLYHACPLYPHILGTPESIRQITADTLLQSHKAFYNLHNMVLCCAGNVRVQEILAAADRCLIPAPPMRAEAVFPYEPDTPAAAFRSSTMPVGKTQFSIGFKSRPAAGTERLRESLLASLTADLLIGSAAPLYQELLRAGLLNDTFDSDCFAGGGWFTVLFEGESDQPETVLQALCDEIHRMQTEGIDTELFAVLKRAAYGDSIIGMNNPEAACTAMLDAYIWDCDFPFARSALLAELTAEDVQKCLRERFCSDNVCLSVIEPETSGKEESEL